jgi:hypothetical protein
MNFKYLLMALGTTALFSCSDDLSNIGSSIQPDSDIIQLHPDTINLSNTDSTYKVESIYAISSTALLGSFTDPVYGSLQCDYLAQFDCPENFHFPELYGGKLDSVTMLLTYRSYIGDSLAPLQVSVYQLNNPLLKETQSNVLASKYCDKSILLGRKGYTAANVSQTNPAGSSYKTVQIKLSDDVAQKFYAEVKNNPSTFATNAAFQKFFKGIYVTNSYGSGSVLTIDDTRMNFYYLDSISKKKNSTLDSTVTNVVSLAVTGAVYLANRYTNTNIDNLAKADTVAYLKAPAGLFTKLKFPIGKLDSIVGKSKLTGAKLVLNTYRVESNFTTLQPPPAVMLIKESDVDNFFSKSYATNATYKNSYAFAPRNSSDNTYTFSNLSAFLSNDLNSTLLPSATENLVLMPIALTQDAYGNITGIKQMNQPSALKIKTNNDNLRLTLVYAK